MKPADRQDVSELHTISVIDALPLGITVQDPRGNLVYANPTGAALLGYPSGPAVAATSSEEIMARFEIVGEDGNPVPLDSYPSRRALRGEEPGSLVVRVRNVETGLESWREATATPILDESGKVSLVVNVFRDITRERQSEYRLAAQYAVARVLTESKTPGEALSRILEAVCRSLRWDLGLLWWLDPAAGVLRWRNGWHQGRPELERFMARSGEVTFGRGDAFPGRVWAEERASWVPDLSVDPGFARSAEAQAAGLRGACGFPIMRGGETIGVMEFFSREVRSPDPDLLQMLDALGAQVGLLVERDEARQNQRFLLEVGELLSAAMGYEETLRQVTRAAVPRLADTCIVYLRDEETDEISRVAAADRSREDFAERLDRHPLDPHADQGVPKVIRTGQVELHTEATLETLAVDVRDREAFLEAMAGIPVRSWMSVPLTARGRTFGAVSLVTSVSGRRLDERDLELARDLARRAALEVDNALLFRAEEEAQQRLAFLAEASRLLTRSLDYDRTPRRLASLAVPRLGDWCVVDLMGEDGTLRHAAVEHVDPAKVELARELGRRYPPDPNQDDGTIRVIRTGEPELYPDIPDEMLVRSARDEEHLRILRELDLRSVLIVPLTARGRTFGTISLVAAESGRRYGDRDLELAMELARRAGAAMDNARLYRQSAHIARTLQRTLLPPSPPEIEGLELAARYRPGTAAADIGGDFYDMYRLDGDRWAVVIGDVCGKGIEAAAVTGLARHTFRTTLRQGRTPEEAFEVLNEEMELEGVSPTFCTMAYAEIRATDRGATAEVICAGHPIPLLLRAGGEVESAGAPGTLIGAIPDLRFEPRTVHLGPGDALFLFTDGLIEGLAGHEGAEAVLRGVLAGCAGLTAQDLAEAMESALGDRAVAARDDTAFVVLRVPPAAR